MKTKIFVSVVAMLTVLLIGGGTGYAQNAGNDGEMNKETSTDYHVISRLDMSPRPTAFQPTKATPVNGAVSENIITSTERILNEKRPFLKKGVVKPVGEDQFSAWQMASDEGGHVSFPVKWTSV